MPIDSNDLDDHQYVDNLIEICHERLYKRYKSLQLAVGINAIKGPNIAITQDKIWN